MTTSTIGPEWASGTGGLHGELDGTAASSTVTGIAAGTSCTGR